MFAEFHVEPCNLFSPFIFKNDGTNWLQDIEEEASTIKSWEVEAEKLSLIALASFQNLKSGTTNIMENATIEAMSWLEASASALYSEVQMSHDDKKKSWKEKHKLSSLHFI